MGVESLRGIGSEEYYTLDDQAPPPIWDVIAGLYPTKDQSFIRIHTNFPQFVPPLLLQHYIKHPNSDPL